MATLIEDVRASAEWIAKALTQSRYRADFTMGSLREVERFFEEHSTDGVPAAGGQLTQDTEQRLFALGAYVGETLRRELGGIWQVDDDDPYGEINVRLRLNSGDIIWPVQRVIKRFRNGTEDSITAYAALLGTSLGTEGTAQPAEAPRRHWFRQR
ncbi:hypothetical protein [Streptomyces sp. NPDC047009]|uniref:hypothetical protein n=1 Tax=unclassified Streptomyces TaxID=2593676 RepID=UPI0033ECC1D1